MSAFPALPGSPVGQEMLFSLHTSRVVTGVRTVSGWGSVCPSSFWFPNAYYFVLLQGFQKYDNFFFKGTQYLRLSVIIGPGAQPGSASCVVFYRLPAGLESTVAWLSPWRRCLPGEGGPGV